MKKTVRSAVSLLLAALILLCCPSCVKVSATELSARYEPSGGVVNGNYNEDVYAKFSSVIFKGAAESGKGNVLVSPYSGLLCLIMTANGANGQSLAQIEELLGCRLEELNSEAAFLISSLRTGKGCKISTANSIWIRNSFEKSVLPAYLQKNADIFKAQVYSSPFDASTVKDVNLWCDKQTDGMIKKIIDRIDGNDMMFLINSLLFDAEWNVKYENKDIKDGVFNCCDGTKKDVKMLVSDERFVSGEGYSGYTKKYKGGDYLFTAILPDDVNTDIFEFIKDLDVKALFTRGGDQTVRVRIPEFSFDGFADLKDIMKKAGVTDMFDRERADFSNMSSEALFCGEFIQKTRVEFDRNGTKAAAVTFGAKGATSAMPPPELVFDRPFVFAINDANTGFPLFIGVVSEL